MKCHKIMHKSVDSAKDHQEGLAEIGYDSRIYRCRKCGYLHITTTKKFFK